MLFCSQLVPNERFKLNCAGEKPAAVVPYQQLAALLVQALSAFLSSA